MSESNYWIRKIDRRRFTQAGLAAGVGVAGLALVGCGDDSSSSSGSTSTKLAPDANDTANAKKGGKIRVLHNSNLAFRFVDPATGGGQTGDGSAFGLLNGETLFAYDWKNEGKVFGRLAASMERPDAVTYIVKLRPGVKFQDGNPLTAEDLVFSMNRQEVTLPGYPGFAARNPVVLPKPQAIDDLTVKWTLANPYPDMIQDLTGSLGNPASKKSYSTSDDPWGFSANRIVNPVTAAPFKVTDFQRNERVDVTRFDGYWDGAKYLDSISTTAIPEDSTRITQLITGEAHLVGNVPPQDRASLTSNAGIVVDTRPGLKVQELFYNTQRGPFGPLSPKTRAFRKAMLMAVDRDALVKHVWDGAGEVANSFMHPVQFGYSKAQKQDAYDPKAAKALLEQNGWDFNYVVQFMAPLGTFAADKAYIEAVAQMLTDIGVKVKQDLWTDYATFGQVWSSRAPDQLAKWDLAIVNLTMSTGSANRVYGILGPNNGLSRYDNPQLDVALEAMLRNDDDASRQKQMEEIQRVVAEDVGLSGLTYSHYSIAWQKKLRNVQVTAEGWDLRNAWLDA